MQAFINQIKANFNFFYQTDEAYSQPAIVDLEKDFDSFSWVKHHCDQQKIIDELFKKTLQIGPTKVTVGSILEEDAYHVEHLPPLISLGFSSIKLERRNGLLILEHPELPGWLIKKNYSNLELHGVKTRIFKGVTGTDFPFWMLPMGKWMIPKNEDSGFKVARDLVHPLRVVMLKRGRQWIKSLQCDSLKACKEYLYQFPDVNPTKPLHQRCVVLSKKENLLNDIDTFKRFAVLANVNPEKLKKIAHQICHWNKYTHLTDLRLEKLRFLDETSLPEKDRKDIIVFTDGEPFGGLSEASETVLEKMFSHYDPGFFPLLGLKNLRASLSKISEEEIINTKDADKVIKIFEDAIQQTSNEILSERKWDYIKKYSSILCPLIPLILLVIATFKACQSRFLSFYSKPIPDPFLMTAKIK